MVAENNTVIRFSGVSLRMVSMSLRNPIFSISSASSRTASFSAPSFSVLLRIWSITLPGVPMTICAPLFSAFICGSMDAPPKMATTFMPGLNAAALFISSAACSASSRVGQRISTCTALLFAFAISTAGRPNAMVFPVPV